MLRSPFDFIDWGYIPIWHQQKLPVLVHPFVMPSNAFLHDEGYAQKGRKK